MVEGLPTRHWRHIVQCANKSGDSIEKGLRWTSALIRKNWEISWDMWVARNDLVHNDGEVRDTLVIANLNSQIKQLQKEGSRCQDLFRDDRKFFKTPYWKVIKKTEQQKVRYIETAIRLMDDSRKASQQTLNNWRLHNNDSSSESELEMSDGDSRQDLVQQESGTATRLQQSLLRDFYLIPTIGNATTASIDGESDGTTVEGNTDSVQSSDEDDWDIWPPAGSDQPSAGPSQPPAGLSRPTADLNQPPETQASMPYP